MNREWKEIIGVGLVFGLVGFGHISAIGQGLISKRYVQEGTGVPVQFDTALAFHSPFYEGYFLTGEVILPDESQEQFTVQVNGAGDVQWAVRFPEETDFFVDGEGGMILHEANPGAGHRRLARLDASTLEPIYQWQMPASEEGEVMMLTESGDLAVAEVRPDNSVRVVRLSPQGEVLWAKDYSAGDTPTDLALTPLSDGGLLLTWGNVISFFGFTFREATVVVRLTSNGDVSWSRRLSSDDGGFDGFGGFIAPNFFHGDGNGGFFPGMFGGLPSRFHEMDDGGLLGSSMGAGINVARMEAGGGLSWAREYPDLFAFFQGFAVTESYRLFGLLMEEEEMEEGEDFDLVILNLNPATGQITEQTAIETGGPFFFSGAGVRQNHFFVAAVGGEDEEEREAFVVRFESDLSNPLFRRVAGFPSPILASETHPLAFTDWNREQNAAYLFTAGNDLENPACDVFAEFAPRVYNPNLASSAVEMESETVGISVSNVAAGGLLETPASPITVTALDLRAESGCPSEAVPPAVPEVSISILAENRIGVSFTAEAGNSYFIEFTPTLPADWEVIETIAPDENTTVQREFEPSGSSGFYRIRVQSGQ